MRSRSGPTLRPPVARSIPWHRAFLRCAGLWLPALAISVCGASAPIVTSIVNQSGEVVLATEVPPGFANATLEAASSLGPGTREFVIAGPLGGQGGVVTFRLPNPGDTTFLRVRLGTEATVPPSTYSGSPFFSLDASGGQQPLSPEEKAGHLLNRLAYGPSVGDFGRINQLGLAGYIEQQLNPASIDETGNVELAQREEELFATYRPRVDTHWIKAGDVWRYFKGTQAPPAGWNQPGFNDTAWLQGPTGIGYGDDDDATELEDMRQTDTQPGYLSVFLRRTFNLPQAPAAQDTPLLRIDFDDGFVAYLNGVEVARANLPGNPPTYTSAASSDHEAGEPVEFDLSAHRSLLRAGENVLAIQIHNLNRGSSDLSLIPELLRREFLALPPVRRINGIEALQQLAHVRGIYSARQLQMVLGEFWENHFTTDYDKVAEYFEDLRNSDARRAMNSAQAAAEAAQAEYFEYQFFVDNALGNFGDLLLFSATSPAQLIYLDNVLNVKGAANENYAREILELFAFGVDNRYTQEDIEQLARCFTGWSIRKIAPDQYQPFPASARNPPTQESVQFVDDALVPLGAGWKYFKGTAEPSPGPNGAATTEWTNPDFNDAAWLSGSTGIGYGDGDDATSLTDMRNRYLSVYLRREFTISNPADLENLLLAIDYDDGYVAYLNGTEIARSETMENTGTPPRFNRTANGSHEAGDREETVSLGQAIPLLRPAPEKNVLAIQVHNLSRDSTDVSLLPRLVDRRNLPGSIENGDPNGVWTFRFNPDRHDTGAKVVFRGTPFEVRVPAGRTGVAGLQDALDVVDTFVRHPSVSEFISLKLINKFVSDEIHLENYHDRSAAPELLELMDRAIETWNSTQPAGNIRTVLRAILDPLSPDGPFWSRAQYRAKVKTPIEFINSSVRALQASVDGTTLASANDRLGMHLFSRDDPDGWSELGHDWIDTGTLLARIQFAQALSGNTLGDLRWDVAAWTSTNGLTTAESIIEHFNQLLFQGQMAPSNRELLLRFGTTDDAGNPLPLEPSRTDYARRVRELTGLILSMPQWHYQ